MPSVRPAIWFTLSAVAALMLAAPLLAQAYGPNDQVLTVSSLEFRPFSSDQSFEYGFSGYLGPKGEWQAPLRLPEGAEITQMCLYSYDPDGSSTVAVISANKLPAGGQMGGDVTITAVTETFNIGFGSVCTAPFSFTILSDADLDGEGTEHLAYVIAAATGSNSQLGGVRITWHRQVSDPPATPSFADVPVGAFGFAQIEALAAAAITGGCGGGNYCPNQPVTRAQMAIFLAKALGLYWGN